MTSLAQQSRLLALAPEVGSALGPGVAAEAELTPDGDVALRVRGLRHASLQLTRAMRPLEAILRAVPTLVPVGVLADRQEFSANWGALGHVLVASSTGTGATAILTSVLARVAARRTPAELQVRTIAPPRALPAAVLGLPHQLGPAVDPQDQDAMAEALSGVRAELDRRLLAGSSNDQPELVVIVAELLDLEPYVGLLGQLGERGAACGVRLLAASTRPGGELAAHPLLPDFSTRLVQRAADEDESLVLLGTADAAYLGGGGRLLFRVEQRTPVELYAYRVAPADLDRLVDVMTTAYGAGANRRGPVVPSSPTGNHDGQELAVVTDEGGDGTVIQEEEPVVTVSPQPAESLGNGHGKASSVEALANTVTPNGCDGLLPPEREALLEVRCFAGPRLLRDNEELWPAAAPNQEQKAFQLLLFLAAHSAEGVDRDKAAEALLGEDESTDPAGTLRQWRKRVRTALGRLVPDQPEEDLFEDSGRIWRLNPRLVRSDVQRFLKLDRWAKSKGRRDPEPAYEAMRALYVGDLFDRAAAQPYAWAVAPRPSGPSLLQEYRQMYQDATRLLAERYAATADDPDRAERALELYEELVRLDPANERLWSALFRLHARLGDRVALERDWRRLRQVLQEEEPNGEARGTTRELYQQLLRELERAPSLR